MFLKYLKNLRIDSSNLDIGDGIVAYNKEWQYPAITEQHAFEILYNANIGNNNSIYIAFPWATLIDKLNKKNQASEVLLKELKIIKKIIRNKKNVVTVCQHVDLLRHQNLFHDLGITHIFWSHTIKEQESLPLFSEVKLLPFPLYPVQAQNSYLENFEKEYLYSFVGAKSNAWYLTQSRNIILDILSKDDRAYIKGRDAWHYELIVYKHQIGNQVDIPTDLLDKDAADEFKAIITKSIFSLCPSGSGPNSIRLWESIGLGAIPVIIADTYLPPGNLQLWNDAVIYCDESEEAIRALPDYLEEIARDPEVLEKKRHALRQLWMIYGPDSFVYDIKKLFLRIE